jgi:hypothetical protein
MKLLFAAFSLMAVAVFALRGDADRSSYLFEETDDQQVETFRAGQTYRYRLDTQVSSGFASISDQHAVTRLQAEAQLHFQSDRLVSLKLKGVKVGTTNQEIQEPEKIQPYQMFKTNNMETEDEKALELPCLFDYVDGLVERIRFHERDQSWSKNIKRSVLNLLQLNLKQRKGQGVELEQPEEWRKERELQDSVSKNSDNQQRAKLFVMPEITLEGECQVTYTMNPINQRSKFNSYNDNQESQNGLKMFNVTKSVDFHRCNKVSDIRFGPKIEKPCENCTNPMELEERRLDRTTIMRHVVVGSPDKYGIKRAEVVSHYIFKMLSVEEDTPMHTVVVGQLNLVKVENDREEIERELKRVETSDKEESLLYKSQWTRNEKIFYMFGDDEFKQGTPFDEIPNKIGKIESLLQKLVVMWSDKKKGIDSEATLVYQQIVEMLRMCSQDELERIHTSVKSGNSRIQEEDQSRAQDILADALANAGTLNTIKVFADKVKKGDIRPARAARAIIQMKDLPAPSEKQVKILSNLCEDNACARHGACQQVCWLTVGNLMGELCEESRTVDDALDQEKPQCHETLKRDFVTKAMKKFGEFETRYEKIVLLKALGNAGVEPMVFELEKIIRDQKEDTLVRMQAIDSLRRLRNVMPHKIQRVLMPVFQNVRERPEIRMMAVSQILATFPQNQLLDQIGYTLIRDSSRQVKSFVYGAMKQLSQSPIDTEMKVAQHLKTLLKLADITEEDAETLLRGSRYYRIPVYSQAHREGFFLDLESMVGTDNILPKHLTAGLDTMFNGLFQKNSLEVNFAQEDVEQWFEKLMDMYMDFSYGSSSSRKTLRSSRRSDRDSGSSEADTDFRKIIDDLKIKRRNRVDSDVSRRSISSPYAMLSFRYGDIDYAILPLEEEILPSNLKRILQGQQQPSLRDLKDLLEYSSGHNFRVQAAVNLLENSVKIPTSVGFPIRAWHVIPMLASVEGQLKPELESRDKMTVQIKLHPMLSITHLKRVEVWSPIVNSGVDSTRTASINLPLNTKLEINYGADSSKGFKWSVEVPQEEFRVVNLHTLPLTYIVKQDWTQTRTPVVKRIENQNLANRVQHVDRFYGKQNFGMPLKINGELHAPHRYNYQDIVSTLLSTENHLHIQFIPDNETPRQIVLLGEGQVFRSTQEDRESHRQLKGFHSRSRFDTEMDQYYESESSEGRFDKYLDDLEPSKMYKHSIKMELKTVGGRNEKQCELEIQATCDSENRFMKTVLRMKRSALPYFGESGQQWTMRTEAQVVLPEVHSTIQKFKSQQGQKQQKLVAKIDTEWGSSEKQKISMNINGEQARDPMWSRKIEEVQRLSSPDAQRLHQQMIQKSAFINKYDISVEYENLQPSTYLNSLSTILKSWNFWQTQVESKKTSSSNLPRDGQATATIVIDPMTHEHANVTVKTPQEIVRTHLSLPMKVKPFKLVKPGQVQQSIDSMNDIVRDYAVENTRQECKVNGRKVVSFDEVIFKSPLTKCYSVLAKDCSSETPRFAVMMKKLNDEDKALKVLTKDGEQIKVYPENGKLVVKINGQREESPDRLEEFGIDYSKKEVRIANRDITVRFDGEEATVKINPSYKQSQCGLCGHYDDDSEDEFRMSNNELTNDIKSFHKSYSLVNDECRGDLEETHREGEYKQLKHRREYDEEEQDQKQGRKRNNDNYETEPVEKTEVMEYNHKICFSIKPVKACPEDSYADKTKEQKISFTCLDRTSSEARRLLREARRTNRPVELPSTKPSFVETLTVPSTCVVY